LEEGELERFSVYGFSIDYPPVCRFEFNPKARREKGDIVMHFPDREKVYLSWGPLATGMKKFQTAREFAEHSVKSMGKSRNVGKSNKLKETSLRVNSHDAYYQMVRFQETSPALFGRGRSTDRITCSVHLFCERSSRYFVIYSLLSPNAPEDFDQLFLKMVETFSCH
jgi:hypothetical protein